MVEIKIKLKDEKFRKDFDALQAVIPEINALSLWKAAEFVRGWVQKDYLRGPRPELLDVRSGRLIGSIQSKIEYSKNTKGLTGTQARAYVGSNAVSKEGYNYPGYWEYDGSKHGGPRPFLGPAVEENADKWINIWIGELKKRLEAWLSARAF